MCTWHEPETEGEASSREEERSRSDNCTSRPLRTTSSASSKPVGPLLLSFPYACTLFNVSRFDRRSSLRPWRSTLSNLCLLAGLLTYRHRGIRGLTLKQPVHFVVGCLPRKRRVNGVKSTPCHHCLSFTRLSLFLFLYFSQQS